MKRRRARSPRGVSSVVAVAIAIATAAVLLAGCGSDSGGPSAAADAADRAAVVAPGLPPQRAGSAARLALAGDRLQPTTDGQLSMLDVAVASAGIERVIETGAKRATAAIRLEHLVLTASDDNRLRVWRPATGVLIGEDRTRRPFVSMVEAHGLPLVVAADAAGELSLVDVSDPHRPRLLPMPASRGRGPALALAFSGDSSEVLVVRANGELERFATRGAGLRGRRSLLAAISGLPGAVGPPSAALLYTEGAGVDENLLLAERSGAIIRFNLKGWSGSTLVPPDSTVGRITALAKRPYGELAAATRSGLLTLEDADAEAIVARGPAVTGVGFGDEGELWTAEAGGVDRLAEFESWTTTGRPASGMSAGAGGLVATNPAGAISLLGSLGSGLELPSGDYSPVVGFDPGGGLILAESYDANHVERLVMAHPGRDSVEAVETDDPAFRTYDPGPDWWPDAEEGTGLFVNDVAVDEEFLVAGGQDPTGEAAVLVWDARSGRPVKRLPLATGGVVPSEPSIVADVVLAPKQHLLAAYSTVQQAVVIWSTEDWHLLASLPVGPVGSLSLSPDGSTLLAVGLSEDVEAVTMGEASSKLIFIDTASGSIDDEVVTGDVDRAEFSPNGADIALLGVDGSLRLRSADGRDELVRPIQLESEPVDLAWRPDGSVLAVSMREAGLALVEPRHGKVTSLLPAERSTAFSLDWSADGRLLAAAPSTPNEESGDFEPGQTQVWNLGEAALRRRMCELSGGPISASEWRLTVDRQLPYEALCPRRIFLRSGRPEPQQVLLGSGAFELNGAGWGTAEPADIFNGGDPSGSISEIEWRSWGGAIAIGFGDNPIFKPEGGYYARPARIELRASHRGFCGLSPAYTRLEVRVPRSPGGPLGPWLSWSGDSSLCNAAA